MMEEWYPMRDLEAQQRLPSQWSDHTNFDNLHGNDCPGAVCPETVLDHPIQHMYTQRTMIWQMNLLEGIERTQVNYTLSAVTFVSLSTILVRMTREEKQSIRTLALIIGFILTTGSAILIWYTYRHYHRKRSLQYRYHSNTTGTKIITSLVLIGVLGTLLLFILDEIVEDP